MRSLGYSTLLLLSLIAKNASAEAVVTTLAGNRYIGTTDGVGTQAEFNRPSALTCDGKNLYVGDDGAGGRGNRIIRRVVLATGAVTTIAGRPSRDNYVTVDGVGKNAIFTGPTSLANDGTNLYVGDINPDNAQMNRTRQVALSTSAVTTLPYKPAMALYRDQNDLYLVPYLQRGGTQIIKIDLATGQESYIAGDGFGYKDGIGKSAEFRSAFGLTGDGKNLYVADQVNHAIRMVVLATGEVSTLAGDGSQEPGSADGVGRAARFLMPSGITTPDGVNLYVTDGNRLRKVVIATGEVSTIAGKPDGAEGAEDGVGRAAGFRSLTAITHDGTNLYVGDLGNHLIRKISFRPDSVVTPPATTAATTPVVTPVVTPAATPVAPSAPVKPATPITNNDLGTFSVASVTLQKERKPPRQYKGGVYYVGIGLDFTGTQQYLFVTGLFQSENPALEFSYPEKDTQAYLGMINSRSKNKGLTAGAQAGLLAPKLDKNYPMLKLKTPLPQSFQVTLVLSDAKTKASWSIPVELKLPK